MSRRSIPPTPGGRQVGRTAIQSTPVALPGTYGPEQLGELMRRAGNVDLGEVYAAADTMLGFLRGNGLSVALMGGLSLHARGSGRTTSDVDIAVDANMARVKQVMASQQSILYPRGPTSGVMRVFVPIMQDPNTEQRFVEVDLILAGSLGAPTNLEECSETVEAETPTGSRAYTVIDLKHIMSSKLAAFEAGSMGNDYSDLAFLVQKYAPQISSIRAQLSQPQRATFFTAFCQNNGGPARANVRRKVAMILGIAQQNA